VFLRAIRYVERNPVRAGLVARPSDWPWSSAAAHVAARDDLLVQVRPLVDTITDWPMFLSDEEDAAELYLLRRHARTSRSLGDPGCVARLETLLGRNLRPQEPGPKPASEGR